jgi:TonB family protein
VKAHAATLFFAMALAVAAQVEAHDLMQPPKALATADGVWPDSVASNTDVLVPLMVVVDATGQVTEASIEVSVGTDIDAAALDAARHWHFEPATIDDTPMPAKVRVVVRFRAPSPAHVLVLKPNTSLPASSEPGSAQAERDETIAAGAEETPAGGDGDEFGAHAVAELPSTRSASEVVRQRDTLMAAPHRTANDMLVVVPGLFVTQHSGEGKAYQIFYRGFDAVHGQDLEIWAGGAPVNDVSNIHGQGYADLHFIMPEVVRTLHVTPGTYDPRQGDFAVAGTVRLELGFDQPGLTAKAGYGSFGTSRYFLAYRPKDANEQTFAAVEVYGTDGFGPSRAAQRSSAIAQGRFHIAKHTDARLLLTGYTAHFASAGVLRLADLRSGAVSRLATYDPSQGGASTRTQLVAEVSHESRGAVFSIAPYFVLRTLRLKQNFTGFLDDPNGDLQQQLNDAITVGGRAFYRRRLHLLAPNDTIEAGVFVRSDWIDQSQKQLASVDQAVTDEQVDARVRAMDIAGYVDLAVHAFSVLTLRGGVRVDGLSYSSQDDAHGAEGQARSSQGAHVGPKVSLEGRLWRGLSAVTSYGEGFRSPQARSLAEGQTTPFTRVKSFEGGLRYADERLGASAAAFRTWLSDDLVFDQATARNETVPATARTGTTVDATWKPRQWIDLTVNGTYTWAEFRASDRGHQTGDLVPYAPQLVARADLAASPVLGEAWGRTIQSRLGTGLSYLARRPLPYGQFGHDIFLIDAHAELRFGEVALYGRVFNLLDAQWFDGEFLYASNWDPGQGASLVPLRHVTIGAPRTIFVSVEITI